MLSLCGGSAAAASHSAPSNLHVRIVLCVTAAFWYSFQNLNHVVMPAVDIERQLESNGWLPSLTTHATSTPGLFRTLPRQVTAAWNSTSTTSSSKQRNDLPRIQPESKEEQLTFLDEYEPRSYKRDMHHLEKYLVDQFEDDYVQHCVDMKEWQSTSFPTCNSVHELGLDPSKLSAIGSGGWRQVFFHAQARGSVLKMLHLDVDEEYAFDPQAYEIHRVDAVVSERLTSSPFVLHIHGYCGTSALYEQGKHSLKHDIDGSAINDRYRRMMEIAHAMADMHGVDYSSGSNATIVHRDLKPSNIMIGMDGNAKLGDFNDAILRKWNKTSGEPCPFYNIGYPLFWGLGYKPAEHAAKGYPKLDEKVDMYGLGGLLFFALTDQNPFEEYNKENMTAAINAGLLPQLPERYNVTKTPGLSKEVSTVVQAIERTMVLDPKARPTSKEVLEMLEPVLRKYES